MERTHAAADALEFQVRKDIRNRPLREVDHAGQRRMWGSSVVVLVVLCVLLAAASIRTTLGDLGYRIATLQDQRVNQEADRRHWLAERETLRSQKRIEGLATTGLKLVEPQAADVEVIDRVKASPEPSSAIVASR